MDPDLVSRVRSEFLEMPGLRVTLPQAARLFGVSLVIAARILTQLAHEGMLMQLGDGRYARRT